jgi:diamine N-acetyltransferase
MMTESLMKPISGGVVSLRALEPEDADLLYEWENDCRIWHLSNTIAPLSRFALEQYILNTGQDIFATRQLRLMIDLQSKGGKTSIGSVDLFEFEPLHLRAGAGLLVNEKYRGRGYASEALTLLIGYAFGTLRLHQLYANVSASNHDSIKLFKKNGFLPAGIKKEWNRLPNKWEDELMFQLINPSSVIR